MNFLEIAQEVRRGVGMQGTGPSSITGATQTETDMIDSVRDAWIDIQNFRQEWMWMRNTTSFLTTATQGTYTLLEIFGPSYRFKNWIKDTMYVKRNGLWQVVRFVDYDTFVFRQNNNTNPEYPSEFTIVPWNDSIMINEPDAAYEIKVEYYKSPQRLVAATDVPEFPEYYHIMIKYHAIAKFTAIVVQPSVQQESAQAYAVMMGQLMRDMLMKKRVKLIGIA
jgi:hypothetical protein